MMQPTDQMSTAGGEGGRFHQPVCPKSLLRELGLPGLRLPSVLSHEQSPPSLL